MKSQECMLTNNRIKSEEQDTAFFYYANIINKELEWCNIIDADVHIIEGEAETLKRRRQDMDVMIQKKEGIINHLETLRILDDSILKLEGLKEAVDVVKKQGRFVKLELAIWKLSKASNPNL